jgi:hypothetical protein
LEFDGERPEPYRALLAWFHGVAAQEHLLYRLQWRPGEGEAARALSEIDQYVQALDGSRSYSKPPPHLEVARFAPFFRRYVRAPFSASTDELKTGVRLLGHLRETEQRPYIAALAGDRDRELRQVVAEALYQLGGKESIGTLAEMAYHTDTAAWALIRLGDAAVPAIVELLSRDLGDGALPDTVTRYETIIRAYLDHWQELPALPDERVLDAVRANMQRKEVREDRTTYHLQLLKQAEEAAKKAAVPREGGDGAAWGEARDGLQAGLAFEQPSAAFPLGANVALRIKLRNTGERPIVVHRPRVPVMLNWSNYRRPPSPQVAPVGGEAIIPYERGVLGVGRSGSEAVSLEPGSTIDYGRVLLPIRSREWKAGLTVNLLAFQLEPGEYEVSIPEAVSGSVSGEQLGPAGTGKLRLSVVEAPAESGGASDKVGAAPPGGVLVVARPDRAKLKAGEPLIVLIDIQNLGDRPLQMPDYMSCGCSLEINGDVVEYFGPISSPVPAPLLPGQEIIQFPIVLSPDSGWGLKSTLEPKPLTAGKHTIRAIWSIERDGKPFVARSEPFEVEVSPAE